MHEIFLSLRYLRKRRLAFFGVAAVTLCVALLIVVTSLFYGFIDSYLTYARRLWGDVILIPPAAMTVQQYQQVSQVLEKVPGVHSAMPMAQMGGLLYLRPGEVRAVQIIGTDLERRSRDAYFRGGLFIQGGKAQPDFTLSPEALEASAKYAGQRGREGGEAPVGMIVGAGILGQPDELTDEYHRGQIADEIKNRTRPMIITTGRSAAEAGQASMSKRNIVTWPVDAVQTGLNEADTNFVYLPFERVCKELSPAEGPPRCLALVQIETVPGSDNKRIIEQVRAAWQREIAPGKPEWFADVTLKLTDDLPSVKMITREIRKQLFIWHIMLGLICVVVAFLIFVILYMIVMQKKRDIGIVRSVGASRASVARIFLLYGGAIGIAGSLLGLLAGSLVVRNLSVLEAGMTRLLGFKIWKSGVYLFSQIPDQVAWHAAGWIMLAGFAAAVLGAALPAWRAARLQPVQTLRYE